MNTSANLTNISNERRFFHFLARLSVNERKYIEDGKATNIWYKNICLEILRGILEFGFLLTPEEKTLYVHDREYVEDDIAIQNIQQCRCSFTLSKPDKLMLPYPGIEMSHRELFGEIAIAIKPNDGKSLGMHPCAYYQDGINLSEFSDNSIVNNYIEQSAINAQLTQVSDVLKILSIIESLSRPEQPPSVAKNILQFNDLPQEVFKIGNLSADEGEALINSLTCLSSKNAEMIIDTTNIHRESMFDLYGKLQIIQSVFQNISAVSRCVPFHYYDQQEWRLARSISESTFLSCLDVEHDPYGVRDSDNKKNSLSARQHVQKIASLRNHGYCKSIDFQNYWIHWGLFENTDGATTVRKIYDLIDYIICPDEWFDGVSMIVREIGVNKEPIKIISWENIERNFNVQ